MKGPGRAGCGESTAHHRPDPPPSSLRSGLDRLAEIGVEPGASASASSSPERQADSTSALPPRKSPHTPRPRSASHQARLSAASVPSTAAPGNRIAPAVARCNAAIAGAEPRPQPTAVRAAGLRRCRGCRAAPAAATSIRASRAQPSRRHRPARRRPGLRSLSGAIQASGPLSGTAASQGQSTSWVTAISVQQGSMRTSLRASAQASWWPTSKAAGLRRRNREHHLVERADGAAIGQHQLPHPGLTMEPLDLRLQVQLRVAEASTSRSPSRWRHSADMCGVAT